MKKQLLSAALLALASNLHAAIITYQAHLDGPSETPSNASPGTGFAQVVVDTVLHTMDVSVTFSGLTSRTTASHIHGPTSVPGTGTAGVATATPTFPGFPSGVTSGSYHQLFDMTLASTYRAGFITANGGTPAGAEAVLSAALAAGKSYLNIHTTAFPGGEIRGFLQPVPEPGATGAIAGIAAAVLAFRSRRKV